MQHISLLLLTLLMSGAEFWCYFLATAGTASELKNGYDRAYEHAYQWNTHHIQIWDHGYV
jgi:hypothetical protein